MNNDITIQTKIEKNSVTLQIGGDVTGLTGKALKDSCLAEPVYKAKTLVLHFDRKCYINSDGIAFLFDIVSESKHRSQKVRATGLSEHYKKIFHLVGLTNILDI